MRLINQYSKDGELIKTWSSLLEIENHFDRKNFPYFRMTLKGCLNDPTKRLAGYIWQFADESKVTVKKVSIFF